MKKTLFFLLIFCLFAGRVSAAPKSVTTVSPDALSNLEMLHQQATDYLIKNQFEAAIRVYSDILLIEPDDETAYTGLGQIYMVLGQTKKAHEAFQNALDIDPYNEVAQAGIRHLMDPDGVEGMTNKQEPGIDAPKDLLMIKHVNTIIDPGRKAWAKPALRLGPQQVADQPEVDPRALANHSSLGKLSVQRVQMALKNAGLYTGSIDGVVGKRTQLALKQFQKMHGLEVTGSVNVATWRKLASYLE